MKLILLITALICMAVALISIGFLASPFTGSRDARIRFNEGVSKAQRLFSSDIPEDKKEEEVRKLVSEYLGIGAGSKDPAVQSGAYFNAGFLLLLDYDKARQKDAILSRPSSERLQSAIQHFSKAARICGGQENRTACFFSEIQTNLDYAQLLWSRENPQGLKKSKESAASSERKQSPGPVSSDQNDKDANENIEGDQKIIGSVRGAHSKEPKETRNIDNGGAGSGFTVPPNLP